MTEYVELSLEFYSDDNFDSELYIIGTDFVQEKEINDDIIECNNPLLDETYRLVKNYFFWKTLWEIE